MKGYFNRAKPQCALCRQHNVESTYENNHTNTCWFKLNCKCKEICQKVEKDRRKGKKLISKHRDAKKKVVISNDEARREKVFKKLTQECKSIIINMFENFLELNDYDESLQSSQLLEAFKKINEDLEKQIGIKNEPTQSDQGAQNDVVIQQGQSNDMPSSTSIEMAPSPTSSEDVIKVNQMDISEPNQVSLNGPQSVDQYDALTAELRELLEFYPNAFETPPTTPPLELQQPYSSTQGNDNTVNENNWDMTDASTNDTDNPITQVLCSAESNCAQFGELFMKFKVILPSVDAFMDF